MLQHIIEPIFWKNTSKPPGVQYLRECILHALLLGAVTLGLAACLPSVWMAWNDAKYDIAIVDILCYLWAVALFLAPNLSYRVRAANLLLLVYMLGVWLLVSVGPVSEIYLFGFSVLAALLLGLRAALAALALTGATLLFVGYATDARFIIGQIYLDNSFTKWSIITLNFVFVNAIVSISLAVLIRGLEDALQREQHAAEDLAAQRSRIMDVNTKLNREIAERKRTEDDLLRLARAVDQASEGIVIADHAGHAEYMNSGFEAITGISSRQASTMNLYELAIAFRAGAQIRRIVSKVSKGQTWKGQVKCTRPDGLPLVVENTISPIRDRRGSIANYILVVRDMTQEVQLESRLRQAQKLEAIGTLAGGIAHDFNNILVSIFGYAELLKEDLPEDSSSAPFVDEILYGGTRARELIQQILAFSRRLDVDRSPCDLGAIVKESLKLLRPSLPATIEIRSTIDPEIGYVHADPTQLHQVVMNLCTNAYHAMELHGGVLDLNLASIQVDEEFAASHPSLAAGQRYLRLIVSDTGCGMDSATLERIFDPFFTTKQQGKGTGLGLATVHGIVSVAHGAITAYSEPGMGTAFHLYFPEMERTGAPPDSDRESTQPGQGERILFVDDEPAIVRYGSEMLRRLGYDVTTCGSGTEALTHLQAQTDAFDLLITDQTMPRLTGTELIEAISPLAPELPTILMSGFSTTINQESLHRLGVNGFLQKPFTREEIARAIREALSSGAAGDARSYFKEMPPSTGTVTPFK